MSFMSKVNVFSRPLRVIFCSVALIFFGVVKAQAVTIDFDDLNYEDYLGSEEELQTPLSDEYESLGVLFSSSTYLKNFSWRSLNSVNGPGFSFYFINDLPTFVSMYVGSFGGYKVGVRARGADGYFEDKVTEGAVRGNPDLSTPYEENQFVSFYIPQGISSIEIDSQGLPYMDDLTFTLSLPEPGSVILMLLGMLTLYLQTKRLQ